MPTSPVLFFLVFVWGFGGFVGGCFSFFFFNERPGSTIVLTVYGVRARHSKRAPFIIFPDPMLNDVKRLTPLFCSPFFFCFPLARFFYLTLFFLINDDLGEPPLLLASWHFSLLDGAFLWPVAVSPKFA